MSRSDHRPWGDRGRVGDGVRLYPYYFVNLHKQAAKPSLEGFPTGQPGVFWLTMLRLPDARQLALENGMESVMVKEMDR
jgi:hypothetical protein